MNFDVNPADEDEHAECRREIERLHDLAESAWGVIANAYGGDWELAQNRDWKPAAERWRDQWHDLMPKGKGEVEI